MGARGSRKNSEPEAVVEAAAPPPRAPPQLLPSGTRSQLLGRGEKEWAEQSCGYPPPTCFGALYLSHRDGKSFNTLLYGQSKPFCPGIVGQSRVLLVVRDTSGAVFGAYCGDVWKDPETIDKEAERERRARKACGGRAPPPREEGRAIGFHGDGDCGVFTLRPEREMYRPTGSNRNFMFLQTGWPEEDLNGIGLGGPRMGFHGLYLDRFLDTGHSRGTPCCDTFGSPCLASAGDFTIDAVEAWRAGDDEQAMLAVTGGGAAEKESVLQNKEAAADKEILKHAGRTFHSDNL